MNVTILGATGATGRELTRQAIERGHTVTAVARHPEIIQIADSDRLIRKTADVRDPESMARVLQGSTTVMSGLGVSGGDTPGALTAGARAVLAAAPQRIIWLGAFGTGVSAPTSGWATRTLLKIFLGAELHDKVTADSLVLDAGGTVFHSGPFSNGPLSNAWRTVGLDAVPRRLFPARVSRSTVAAAMLAEAEHPSYVGTIAVPLAR